MSEQKVGNTLIFTMEILFHKFRIILFKDTQKNDDGCMIHSLVAQQQL